MNCEEIRAMLELYKNEATPTEVTNRAIAEALVNIAETLEKLNNTYPFWGRGV